MWQLAVVSIKHSYTYLNENIWLSQFLRFLDDLKELNRVRRSSDKGKKKDKDGKKGKKGKNNKLWKNINNTLGTLGGVVGGVFASRGGGNRNQLDNERQGSWYQSFTLWCTVVAFKAVPFLSLSANYASIFHLFRTWQLTTLNATPVPIPIISPELLPVIELFISA